MNILASESVSFIDVLVAFLLLAQLVVSTVLIYDFFKPINNALYRKMLMILCVIVVIKAPLDPSGLNIFLAVIGGILILGCSILGFGERSN